MKKISPKKYAIALYEMVKGADQAKISYITKSFVKAVIDNKDVNKIDKIINAFTDYYNVKENKMEVTIITAEEIKDQLVNIKNKLKNNFGKDIVLKTEINSNIIGGIIIKYGDNVADGSIRRKIQLLAESLK